MQVLSGKEVYRLSVDLTPQTTKPKAGSSAQPRTYYRAKYDGIGFIVDQAFIDAYSKGEVAEVVLAEGSRTVADPLNPDGPKVSVRSLAFNSFATKVQIKSMTTFESELKAIEHPELSKVVLNDDIVAQLLAGLAPKQIS